MFAHNSPYGRPGLGGEVVGPERAREPMGGTVGAEHRSDHNFDKVVPYFRHNPELYLIMVGRE